MPNEGTVLSCPRREAYSLKRYHQIIPQNPSPGSGICHDVAEKVAPRHELTPSIPKSTVCDTTLQLLVLPSTA